MRALILSDAGVRLAANAPDPTPASGEVLVRVTRAGICETDLQLVRGYMGFRGVLGHEFVGVAETGQFAGRRIVGEINCPCRHCDTCRSGRGNHCPNRTVLGILGRNGAFAEFLVLPEENLHLVPDAVSDEAAVFVEPLAAAFRIVEQIPLESTRRVVVLGDGRLGNLCAQVLAEHVPQVIVVGKHETRSCSSWPGEELRPVPSTRPDRPFRRAGGHLPTSSSRPLDRRTGFHWRCSWFVRAAQSCSRRPSPARRRWRWPRS